MYELLLPTLILISVYYITLFVIASLKKNNSIVDIAWGLGFVFLTWHSFILSATRSMVGLAVTIAVMMWGLRLYFHIARRYRGKPVDFRYAERRQKWGKLAVPRSFFQIFLFQGVMMLIIVLPVILINYQTEARANFVTILGFIVWGIGFYFESTADKQLEVFKSKSENEGKLLMEGLWAYTRHPNYFGEALLWWGLYIVGMSVGNPWFTIISPITITLLLLYVSGVPMVEKTMEGLEGFETYKQTTNKFIPGRPKHAS